jgi:hypothetical protein
MPTPFHTNLAVWLGVSASVILSAGNALADDATTADCLSANEKSIASRADHKLRDARAQLLVCASSTCPTDIRKACMGRMAAVNAAIPTIVFEAKDANDNDLTAVSVTMDGQPLAERLEGTAISLDPGEHFFTFQVGGQPKVEKHLVLHEGEKDRRERVVVVSAAVPPSPVPVTVSPQPGVPTSPPPGPPADASKPVPDVSQPNPANQPTPIGGLERKPTDGRAGRRAAGFIVGAIGVASGVGAGLFAFLGGQENTTIRNGGLATSSDISAAASSGKTDNTLAIAFGVGAAVGLGIGIPLVFANLPARSPDDAKDTVTLVPTHGGATLVATFCLP